MVVASATVGSIGCYTGAPANRDVRASWVAHSRGEIVDRWGQPAATGANGPMSILQWSHINTQITLPSAAIAVSTGPGHVEGAAAFAPGEIWHTTTDAAALVDPRGEIRGVDGWALRWGPPNEENLHWGAIFGANVGLGRLD